MKIAYRVLFHLVVLPSLIFMLFAAIADGIAWKLDVVLSDLENKGWPE